MSRWDNFHIWRGRLPHWRADDVTYYVTFKHRRPLTEPERVILFKDLLKPDGRKWNVDILCVLPEQTDLLFRVESDREGRPYELSDIVEKAKTKAGKRIMKLTEERYPPFYTESFDRIVRDESEEGMLFEVILAGPVDHELCEDPEDYRTLWVANAPTEIDA